MVPRSTRTATLWRAAWLVASRELRTAVRDKQTLLYMVVLPLALYPTLFWALLQGRAFIDGRARGTDVELTLLVPDGADGSEELLAALRADDESDGQLQISPEVLAEPRPEAEVELDAMRARLQAEAGPHAILVLGADAATIYFDETDGRSVLARDRAAERLAGHAQHVREVGLAAAGRSLADLEAFELETENLASQQDMGAFLLSFLLPMLLVFMAMMGAFIPAVDCTAGEKERGTAETTLLAPVPRLAVHVGKLAAVVVTSVIATSLNALGIVLAAGHLIGLMGEGSLSISVPLLPLLATLPLALLFIVFSSSVLLAVSSLADTFKQGQSMLGTVQLVFLAPAIAGALPGLGLTPGLALVPILQVVLAFKSILQEGGAVSPVSLALLTVSLLAYTALAVGLALRLMSREEVQTGSVSSAPWRALVRLIGTRS